MAHLTRDDLKAEVQLRDSGDKQLMDTICSSILNLFDVLTERTWLQAAFTEYYDIEDYQDRISLDNRPVASSPAVIVYDDPDWAWGADTIVSADDYRVDYTRGIIYYASYFYGGPQSVKVEYTAGYADGSLPAGIKQILVRQAVVWFKQAKKETWDVQSVTIPAGGGGATVERHEKNLLPEMRMIIGQERR